MSKGRDGYMGVGLSAQGVNMNRLPGWDKLSYGYHGDDGHSFCSSGTGQAYGPTFTTGDVIGCGINLVDGSCFYTKNGHHLGVAFHELPSGLYPTVGLQTPGEVIDANFGQEPFKFDIEGEMRELRRKTRTVIEGLNWPRASQGDPQSVLHSMVSSYLVHHGYSQTAEAFARSTGQQISEEIASMKNRQHIQRLVLSGKVSEAISAVDQLYPGLLNLNQELHFRLKVRQFIELVSGADSLDSVFLSVGGGGGAGRERDRDAHNSSYSSTTSTACSSENMDLEDNMIQAGSGGTEHQDIEINETLNGNTEPEAISVSTSNGNAGLEGDQEHHDDHDQAGEGMEVDSSNQQRHNNPNSILSNPARFEALIRYGQSLQLFFTHLEQEKGRNDSNTKLIQDAFSLLAYPDPWDSPVGSQLEPQGREPVSAALNSAILESKNLPGRPPLEVGLAHSSHLLKLMSNSDLGACAFADFQSLLN